MKINIYYGGRGIVGDPTLSVINRMQDVLEELHVKVERHNLFEEKKKRFPWVLYAKKLRNKTYF